MLAPVVTAVGSPPVVDAPVTGHVRPVFLLLLLKRGSTTNADATMVGSAAAAGVRLGAIGRGLVFEPEGVPCLPQLKMPPLPRVPTVAPALMPPLAQAVLS